MKYIVKLALLVVACTLQSCADHNKETSAAEVNRKTITNPILDEDVANNQGLQFNPKLYFVASGSEPFWSLKIASDSIQFTTLTDTITTPHAQPIQAMDANVKMYKLQTEANNINIQLQQAPCIANANGKEKPYTVTVAYTTTKQTQIHTVEGCGSYVTDYRLDDIWVLTTLNNQTITTKDFANNRVPMLEINTASNTVTGFAGCNTLTAKMFFEPQKLRFTNITTTKKFCGENNKETEFIDALTKTTSYNLGNNKLTLTNPNGIICIFKKID